MTSLSETSLLAGASGQSTGYTIDQSIRFNPGDNTYMHRTQDTADNKRKVTLSWWMKRGSSFGSELCLFAAGASSRYMARMHSDNKMTLRLTNSTTEKTMTTDMVFRDPSAWYHCVWIADCTGGVSTDFSRLYVNGLRATMTGTQPSADTDFAGYGDGSTFGISTNSHSLSSQEWDGYLAEIYLIDGYAYGPEYFGEFKTDTDIWIPKEYTGSYGTNGFFVDGRDSSDLGDDESGNGNDFATNGLAAHDQVPDSPTNNFAVINSVYADDATAGNARTLTNGNLQLVGPGNSFAVTGLTFNLPKSGKWYFEYTIGGTDDGFGYIIEGQQTSINASNGPGNVSASQGGGIQYRGWRNGGTYTTTFADYASSSFSAGDIHQVAIDVDNNDFYYGIANVYQAADAGKDGNPSSGSNPLVADFPFSTNDVVLLAANYQGTNHYNFGQNGTFNGTKTAQGNSDGNGIGNFFYAVPTGFLALCSSNLGAV